MALLTHNCPRCGAKEITFDVLGVVAVKAASNGNPRFELFCKCRRCHRPSIIATQVEDGDLARRFSKPEQIMSFEHGLNSGIRIIGYLSLKDEAAIEPPAHMPENVENAFREGASCLAVGCFNASGAMFRLAIDLATKGLLPKNDGETGGPNRQQRKQLNERLEYLFDAGRLPSDMRELAACVKDDGNDRVHDGTLIRADAEDLLDFSIELFRRMFTEPMRLRIAQGRRDQRRQ